MKCPDVGVWGVENVPIMKDAFGQKNIPILKGSSVYFIPILYCIIKQIYILINISLIVFSLTTTCHDERQSVFLSIMCNVVIVNITYLTHLIIYHQVCCYPLHCKVCIVFSF